MSGEVNTALDRLRLAVDQAGSGKAAAAAMADLAESIQLLVHHMRVEQDTIRQWVDGQAEQQGEIRKLLQGLLHDRADREKA